MSSNPIHSNVYSRQQNVINSVTDLFSLGTPISSTNKTDHHDITEILLKVALNTIKWPLSKLNFCFNYFAKFVGHLAQDCFHSKGGKIYELVPDELEDTSIPHEDAENSRKRKKVRFIIIISIISRVCMHWHQLSVNNYSYFSMESSGPSLQKWMVVQKKIFSFPSDLSFSFTSPGNNSFWWLKYMYEKKTP